MGSSLLAEGGYDDNVNVAWGSGFVSIAEGGYDDILKAAEASGCILLAEGGYDGILKDVQESGFILLTGTGHDDGMNIGPTLPEICFNYNAKLGSNFIIKSWYWFWCSCIRRSRKFDILWGVDLLTTFTLFLL